LGALCFASADNIAEIRQAFHVEKEHRKLAGHFEEAILCTVDVICPG